MSPAATGTVAADAGGAVASVASGAIMATNAPEKYRKDVLAHRKCADRRVFVSGAMFGTIAEFRGCRFEVFWRNCARGVVLFWYGSGCARVAVELAISTGVLTES